MSAKSNSEVRRHLGVYHALWKNSVAREMSFKGNFIMWLGVEFLWFGLQLTFISVVFLQTDHIGDWSKWQVIMLVGVSHFIQEIFQAFFLTNCTQLSELVRTGKLDFMLLLPVNTRFLVSLRQVDLGGFVNAASALGVIAYGAHKLHLVPSLAQIAGFSVLCVAGIAVHYSLMFMLSTVAFWTVRAQGIVWGYYNLFNIARMPDAAFRGFFKVFFRFVIPMLLVSNVPVKVLTRPLESPADMAWLVVAGAVCYLASEAYWRYSLKHYTSASA